MTSESFVCIHGHFYQPPRENPFTGRVDDQPSAAPYRNWNERITAECYTANTAAPILGDEGEVVETVNTYEHISFNFGPTLLEWLEENANDTYRSIIDADRVSAGRNHGHGSAIAQAYNHTILPLSSFRDKVTQVRWGMADFEHRFGRRPEGMWLPETAVDNETLAVLAAEGIRFTILSPYQAEAVLGDDGVWVDLEPGEVDTRIPYRVDVGEGRSITVFFYDGPLSQEIAFNGLLEDGRLLAQRLAEAAGEPNGAPRLAHVATDGETYGHHHKHGEMALAVAIRELEANPDVSMANYSAFLATDPPTRDARVVEDSSWSCAHGVERWRADCGCSTGEHPEWNQTWRAPLREAFDWLRDRILPEFEGRGTELLVDPWEARDAYIEVVLGGPVEVFLDRWARDGVDETGRETALGLIRIQHQTMLMYTSCGWFFEDIGGLEGVFVLRHAGRVIQLARGTLGIDLEPGFLERLEKAVSNVDGLTGRDIYLRAVSPHMG